ncbi:hypothetical protein C2G38_2157648 [Gigaspora rosea]|uniref:Protein kinase domain-containing protein n=1 Tax=Gigaspora rosea TaxID=44941 RepID=A0A397WAA9_9GLOM
MVVLKVLNDSQNITLEFLQEIINSKLVKDGNALPCHGIAQDPQTKNYIMDKLWGLVNVASSLNAIHQQGLVH